MARGIGDNGGPPLDPDESWRHWCWKRAHKRAWKTPPREIALRRLANAEALGMSYREYTLEIMERGRHPTAAPLKSRSAQAAPPPVSWPVQATLPPVSAPAEAALSPVSWPAQAGHPRLRHAAGIRGRQRRRV